MVKPGTYLFDCLFSRSETVHFDKITSRIEKLCYGLASEYLDIPAITLKVIGDHTQHCELL